MAEQHQTPRGSYTTYKPEQKAMIGRYAAEHGNSKAVQKYTSELGVSVKESTVRQFKKAYFLQLNEGKDPDEIKSIPNKKRGRPSKTGRFQVLNEELSTPDFPDEVDISSCIADLINGTVGTDRPVVLILSCTDGQIECQELASMATVKSYANLTDNAQVPDETCALTVGIMVGNSVFVDASLMNRCPKLRIVIRHGIGYENVDVEYAGSLGIIVCNVPDYGVEEVADTAMAHILALFRQTTFMHHAVVEGKKILGYDDYCTSVRSARRIRGKTLGLIGLGKTGIAVALRARAFGFNVIFYDPYTSHGLDKAIGGLERYYTVGDLISKCDCVSLHCMLTKETKHMINVNTFKLFKRGAFLVNVSRGALVEEEALAKALKDGRLGGAALDVHENEPFSYGEGHLSYMPNLICTPHIAWFSKESFTELRMSAIHSMKLALSSMHGVNIQNCVNSDYLSKDACQNRWNPQSLTPECQIPEAGESSIEPDACPMPEPEVCPMPEPDTCTMPEPDACTMPEPDACTMPEPDACTMPEPDACTMPEPDACPMPEPDACPIPEPETCPIPEQVECPLSNSEETEVSPETEMSTE